MIPAPLRLLGAALLVAMVVAAGAGARDLAGGRARHIAVPVLTDPSLPPAPGVALADLPGGAARELARVGARVTALLEDGDGALWIGTFDQGLFRAERGAAAPAPIPGLGGRERFVNALAAHDGLVWAATQGGLLALDGERRALTLLAAEPVPALATAGGALLAATARGLYRVTAGGGAERLEVAGPSGEPLRPTALAAGVTRLWIGTGAGAYSLPLALLDPALLSRTARWHPLVFGEPPAETNVVTALAPLAGGAVAGTDDGGAVRLRDDGGVSAVRFGDARANEVNPGAADAAGGAVLLGTQGGGLLVVRASGAGLAADRLGLTGRAELSAVRVAEGRVLVGRADGVVLELRLDDLRRDAAPRPESWRRAAPAGAGFASGSNAACAVARRVRFPP